VQDGDGLEVLDEGVDGGRVGAALEAYSELGCVWCVVRGVWREGRERGRLCEWIGVNDGGEGWIVGGVVQAVAFI